MNTEEQALKLTTVLYRVTDQFPKDEILTQALRKQGLKILRLVIRSNDSEKIINNVKVVKYYLRLAKSLQVTNPFNIEVLQREYDNLAENILDGHKINPITEKEKGLKDKNRKTNKRQKTIIEYLKEKKQARVGDLQNIFKNISSKTIQRDLHDLVVRKILTRDGDKRWTTYYIAPG